MNEFPGLATPDAPTWTVTDGPFHVVDSEGRRVGDLAQLFGSRLWGHGALPGASATAAPGLGDLHPHALRVECCRRLCRALAGGVTSRDGDGWRERTADGLRAVVLHSGSEAVETALKTALRATGRRRIVAFEGAYHGTFGLALACTSGSRFRDPWASQYGDTVSWLPWGTVPDADALADVAAVIVEPWQGRAGVVAPPPGFLLALREACDASGALFVLDAVLCGAGRTGRLVEGLGCDPDVVCLGKAIGAGVPASAVVARGDVAGAAWGDIEGEALHTTTMLASVPATAGILAHLDRLAERRILVEQTCTEWEAAVPEIARRRGLEWRGTGLVWAFDTGAPEGGVRLARRLLERACTLVLPSGPTGASITVLPAVGTPPELLAGAFDRMSARH